MQIRLSFFFLSVSCILFPQMLYALNEWMPTIITVSGGPVWASGGNQQTLNLAPEITKTYTANKPTDILSNFELFVAIQRALPKSLLAQMGLSLATTSSAKVAGDIWDDADPAFNNYSYKYRVSHTQLALKGKLLANKRWRIVPWISASAGIAFNRADNFVNTPKIEEAVPNPNFSSKTIMSFSYALGFGIQESLIPNWQIGVGYEFADWGSSELGSVSGQTTHQHLTLDHFYTNSVMLNLTYDTEDSLST